MLLLIILCSYFISDLGAGNINMYTIFYICYNYTFCIYMYVCMLYMLLPR